MRWLSKEYQDGAGQWYKTKKQFLFIPKKIGGEWRWLEKAEWVCRKTGMKWYNVEWIN